MIAKDATPPPQPELFLIVKPSEIAVLMSYSKTIAEKAETLQTIDSRSHNSHQSEKPAQCLCETCCMTVEQCRGSQLKQAQGQQDERDKVLDELREIKEYDRIRFHQKYTLPKSWAEAKVTGVFKKGKRIGISAILPGSRCTTEMSIDLSDVRYVCK